MKTVFLRMLKVDDKASALLGAVRTSKLTQGTKRFEVDPMDFGTVPRSPFAYWVTERQRRLFKELSPFEADGRELSIGASTKDDFRYVRAEFEVLPATIARLRADTTKRSWVPFAKGGAFSAFYSDVHLLIHWLSDGAALKADISEYRGSRGWGYQWSAALNGHDRYFRSGLTWPRRTQGGFSMRAMPAGCIFADKGPSAFVHNDDKDELLALLAIANSRPFKALVDMQMAFGSYEVGVIQRTPVPLFAEKPIVRLARLAHRGWSLKRTLDTCTETSHAFLLPALLQMSDVDLSERFRAWVKRVSGTKSELARIQSDIDETCFDLYGMNDVDRLTVTDDFNSANFETMSSEGAVDGDGSLLEDTEEYESTVDAEGLNAEVVSWAISVAFGRFDVRLAIGTLPLPVEPEPFDFLPACSPGMLTGADGLPLVRPPAGYPLVFPESGVLVDDPGHAHDLTAAVRTVFDVVFGNDAHRWLYDVAATLETEGHDLRTWLSKSFFDFHLKQYSKSRRKAPILWQMGTPSTRYSLWLYAHRLTRDSLFQLQNDTVGPKLAHEERLLTNLIKDGGINASASQRREIDVQTGVVEELRGMLDEIKRVAPLWNPNLDDGVVLTMAPLWRLVPQHKSWQRELKSKWDELVSAKYDWSHLAMHLWPERVVPKCATDRSLAIAHGLEAVFWTEEGTDAKWKPRTAPTRPIEDLIRERSSPAVKASLHSLVDAPTTMSSGGARGRNKKFDAAEKGVRN